MTAVEFLFDAVYKDISYPELLGLIAQAKIIEKQQIIDARLHVKEALDAADAEVPLHCSHGVLNAYPPQNIT